MAHCNSSVIQRMKEENNNEKFFFIYCFASFSIVASVLNFLVIYLFASYRFLQTSSNKFLVSLAIGDLLVSTLLGPCNIVLLTSNVSCTFQQIASAISATMAVSGVTIGCIAYDRYQFVKSSTDYRSKMTEKLIAMMILVPWCCPFLLLLSKLVTKLGNAVIVLVIVITIYIILVFSYSKLIEILKHQIQDNHQQNRVNNEKNKKFVQFFKWLLVFAILLTLPIVFNRMLQIKHLTMENGWGFYEDNEPILTALAQCVFLLNSCVNPVLYFFKHSGFTKALKREFMLNDTSERRVRFVFTPKIHALEG